MSQDALGISWKGSILYTNKSLNKANKINKIPNVYCDGDKRDFRLTSLFHSHLSYLNFKEKWLLEFNKMV